MTATPPSETRNGKLSAMQRRIDEAFVGGVSPSGVRDILTDVRAIAGSGKTLRQTLKSELKRTGMTAIALLQDADDLPDGLDVRAVNRWIAGLAQPDRQSHLDYVFDKLRALPDAPTGSRGHVAGRPGRRHPRPGEEWIEVTPEMRAQLRSEIVRTTLSFDAIAEVDGKPEGLTPRIVRGWMRGDARTTRAAHWDFVMRWLNAAPDGGPLPPLTRKRR